MRNKLTFKILLISQTRIKYNEITNTYPQDFIIIDLIVETIFYNLLLLQLLKILNFGVYAFFIVNFVV